jgi:hypothetical protein
MTAFNRPRGTRRLDLPRKTNGGDTRTPKNSTAARHVLFSNRATCVDYFLVRHSGKFTVDWAMNILLKSLPEVEKQFGKKATMATNLLDMVGQGERAFGFLTGTMDDG